MKVEPTFGICAIIIFIATMLSTHLMDFYYIPHVWFVFGYPYYPGVLLFGLGFSIFYVVMSFISEFPNPTPQEEGE